LTAVIYSLDDNHAALMHCPLKVQELNIRGKIR
jgi:hypothetical protein